MQSKNVTIFDNAYKVPLSINAGTYSDFQRIFFYPEPYILNKTITSISRTDTNILPRVYITLIDVNNNTLVYNQPSRALDHSATTLDRYYNLKNIDLRRSYFILALSGPITYANDTTLFSLMFYF